MFIVMVAGSVVLGISGPFKLTMEECEARAAVEQVVAKKGITFRCETNPNMKEFKR